MNSRPCAASVLFSWKIILVFGRTAGGLARVLAIGDTGKFWFVRYSYVI